MERHICKLCNRTFPTGRALGGHMKSHLYPPNRRLKLTESPPESTLSSSSFSSSDTNTPNNRDSSYKLRENPKRSVKLIDPHFIDQEFESESSKALTRPRSNRSRRKLAQNESDSPAVSSVSETSEEELAFCLIMMSRDQWSREEDSRSFQKTRSKKRNLIHQCPVCDRVFATGQALGGHKRAHFIAKNDDDSGKSCSTLIDLNFPPPEQNQQDEEEYLS